MAGKYVIASRAERGFWVEGVGWGQKLEHAQRFNGPGVAPPGCPDAHYVPEGLAPKFVGLDVRVGDEVFWADPDDGLCSGVYTVDAILTPDGLAAEAEDVLLLATPDGSLLEAFLHEVFTTEATFLATSTEVHA